jgi:hypothetical protein
MILFIYLIIIRWVKLLHYQLVRVHRTCLTAHRAFHVSTTLDLPIVDNYVFYTSGASEREMCPWAISINILVIRCPTHGLS